MYYADEPVPVHEDDSQRNNRDSEEPGSSELVHSESESFETAPVTKAVPAPAPTVQIPPTDIQLIVDKMASYVAKNGRDFEDVVKAKGELAAKT